MITIWPYLRLSAGFQGHFEWTSELRETDVFISQPFSRPPRDPTSQLSKKSSHWISCRLPLFLSFSPGSTQLLNNPPVTVTWQQGQIELGMEVVYKKQIEMIVYDIHTRSDTILAFQKESSLKSKNHLEALS